MPIAIHRDLAGIALRKAVLREMVVAATELGEVA